MEFSIEIADTRRRGVLNPNLLFISGHLSGEFNISNLTNDNGFPLGYCDGTKIVEKRFNITTGTFTAIP